MAAIADQPPTARKLDLIHAFDNPVLVDDLDGFAMFVGADTAANLLDVGVVDTSDGPIGKEKIHHTENHPDAPTQLDPPTTPDPTPRGTPTLPPAWLVVPTKLGLPALTPARLSIRGPRSTDAPQTGSRPSRRYVAKRRSPDLCAVSAFSRAVVARIAGPRSPEEAARDRHFSAPATTV